MFWVFSVGKQRDKRNIHNLFSTFIPFFEKEKRKNTINLSLHDELWRDTPFHKSRFFFLS
tara:strand:- start:15 stop:194 length:180 start_codon:yes stop_codon:yes gene_type:complete